jgi:hypothetical protein
MGRKRREHTKPEEEGEGVVTLAATLGWQDLPRKLKSFSPSIVVSRTEREREIEKMEACGMAEGKGMERSRHMVWARIPITPSHPLSVSFFVSTFSLVSFAWFLFLFNKLHDLLHIYHGDQLLDNHRSINHEATLNYFFTNTNAFFSWGKMTLMYIIIYLHESNYKSIIC